MRTKTTEQRGEETARAILDGIRRLVRGLRVASRAAEKQTGLSGAQLFVLHALACNRDLSVNELAARTLTHQSSVSVVVLRLVERGFVRRGRAASDGRRAELALTAAGRRALRRSPDLAQVRMIGALRGMPRVQRARFAALLNDFLARAGFASEVAALFFEDEAPAGQRTRSRRKDR
jgi:DNA-binding MarR family transcriptional regulator